MRMPFYRYLLSFGILLLLSSFMAGDRSNPRDEALLKVILENINASHYQPLAIDDNFSEKAFTLYIKRIDLNKRFLVKADIDQLKRHQFLLDDEVAAGTFRFFDLSLGILDKRLKDAESYYKEILDNPFDLYADESIETDPEKKEFARDETALKEDWRKILKFEVLMRLDEQLSQQEKAKEKNDTAFVFKSLDSLEKESREKISKRYEDWFHRIAKDTRDDRMAFYVNCLVNVYDPHSGYFPPKDKENFDIQMSGQLEGIGATLQERDGYVKVAAIVPGSPSWKQGQLKEGDLILKVAQGKDEPVDIVDMRLDNAVKLIRGKKGTEVRLTVKKPGGDILIIPIVRDVVILEETFAKSAILEAPGSNDKIGYIYLPSFYADFQSGTGRRAAIDVRNAIRELTKEKLVGIIFDLRNDGGGSLLDAVDIAGFFIDKGPVVQVKARFGPPYIYEDKDPGLLYDGPLVVMVNEYSASASEIFSAAMQDYGRGLIVGTPFTFGKGTVQRFVELDRPSARNGDEIKGLGSLKLTIQKFYRINGGSTQLRGVTPDITFPDPYGDMERGEREMEYPMEWTKINPVPFARWSQAPQVDKLRLLAGKRIEKDPRFNLIRGNADRLDKLRKESLVNLNLEKYRARQKKIKEEAKTYETIGKDSTGIEVRPLAVDLEKIQADSSAQARSKAWQNNLRKDIYLQQAAMVLDDYRRNLK